MSTVVEGLDWTRMTEDMNELGCALTSPILTPEQCAEFVSMFEHDELFRSTIDMARYRFGKGRYRYFANPVPEPVARLRAAFWPHLLPIARDWADKLGRPAPWPDDFSDWLDRATPRDRRVPRRFCSPMAPAIGTPCIRTCTASCTSRCRL